MSRLSIHDTPLVGVKLIQRQRAGDQRGFLDRLFCVDELAPAGWDTPIAQINHTYTRRAGTVRGMHFQYSPHAEKKLVTCLKGAIQDVAVDLRPDSPTFLQWHAEELSPDNQRSLLLPEGVAHGFQALVDDVEMLYCHSAPYFPDAEGGVRPTDPGLAIDWPLPIAELSERDAGHPLLGPDFEGMRL